MILCTAMSLVLGLVSSAGSGPSQPNVLFIYLEDTNTDVNVDLGMYPTSPILRPNLDALAARGMRFANAYCPSPVCNPSRVSTMTGQRVNHTGIDDNIGLWHGNTMNGVPSLPLKFLQDGYEVGGVGKVFHHSFVEPSSWHEYHNLGDDQWITKPQNPSPPEQPWLNVYFGPFENGLDGSLGKMRDTKNTDMALDMMSRFPEPFFLAVGYYANHNPFVYPEAYDSLYDPQLDVPPLPFEESTPWQDDIELGYRFGSNEIDPLYAADQELGRREATAAYWRCQTYVDAQIGRLLQGLEDYNLDDNTIVVVVSDHGWSNYHHARYGKSTIYDWSARAEMTVAVPWLNATHGQPCTKPVEHTDLYPTLMELTGLTAPVGLDGLSLSPLLSNPAAAFRPAFMINGLGTHMRMVRSDQYKFVFWKKNHALFDMVNDPGEYDNLYGEPAYDQVVFDHLQYLQQEGLLDCAGYWMNYGEGWPGTQGVPFLTAASPLLDSTFSMSVQNSLGASTLSLVTIGLTPVHVPLGMGNTPNVNSLTSFFLPLAASGATLELNISQDPNLCDIPLYIQILQSDPGALGNVSFTKGLRVNFGNLMP